jgi:hypothetical protein
VTDGWNRALLGKRFVLKWQRLIKFGEGFSIFLWVNRVFASMAHREQQAAEFLN